MWVIFALLDPGPHSPCVSLLQWIGLVELDTARIRIFDVPDPNLSECYGFGSSVLNQKRKSITISKKHLWIWSSSGFTKRPVLVTGFIDCVWNPKNWFQRKIRDSEGSGLVTCEIAEPRIRLPDRTTKAWTRKSVVNHVIRHSNRTMVQDIELFFPTPHLPNTVQFYNFNSGRKKNIFAGIQFVKNISRSMGLQKRNVVYLGWQ